VASRQYQNDHLPHTANDVMNIDKVFVAIIACCLATASICFRIVRFSSTYPVAASMTKSTSARR
jgi:hypothetical protein